VLFLTDLDPDDAGDAGAHATHYEGVPVSEFHQLIATLPEGTIESSTFVDVGAGMGRAMILAATYPFQQVCGVEVSGTLYEVAKENIEIARAKPLRTRDIRLIRNDARLWSYPPGNIVAFLFNPFDGEALMHALAAITYRRDPGTTWLLYHTPVERDIVAASPGWTLHARLACGDVFVNYALPSTSRSRCE
jgi:hypothetical protein